MTHPAEPFPDDTPLARDPLGDLTLDQLYENAHCGYLTIEPDGTIVRVNQTFVDWTGSEREQLIGQRFPTLLTVGGRVYYETHCAPLMTMSGSVREVALELNCADGHRLPILFAADAYPGEGERPLGFRITVFDVSHRRRYERQLLASRDEERAGRLRAEALSRLSDALGAAVGSAGIETVLAAELIGAGLVVTAKVFRPSGGVVRPGSTFTPAELGGGMVGLLPMVSSRGVVLATLRVETSGEVPEEIRSHLQSAAELGGRALERTQQLAALQRTARGGEVTGLPNQRWWRAELDREVRAAGKTGHPLAVLVVEIDQFDRYSQHYGHVAGDRLLLDVVDGFRRAGYDLLSRYGGEEFVLLLPGQSEQDARRILAELRREPALRSAFSAGAATFRAGEDGADMVARAEAALNDERRRRAAAAG